MRTHYLMKEWTHTHYLKMQSKMCNLIPQLLSLRIIWKMMQKRVGEIKQWEMAKIMFSQCSLTWIKRLG
jgi:hypothetical protein